MLFDVECFHDSISLSLVARAGLKLPYSPVPLGLVWQRVALKATTLRDWRSCRSRTSCTHPPRLRDGWMTWHSARKLRRVRWSIRRSRRLSSWCGICKRTNWRLRQRLWSSQLHQALPSRLSQRLQDVTYTPRKPVKPSIWAWTCPVQESLCVEPWPRDGRRRAFWLSRFLAFSLSRFLAFSLSRFLAFSLSRFLASLFSFLFSLFFFSSSLLFFFSSSLLFFSPSFCFFLFLSFSGLQSNSCPCCMGSALFG